MVQRTRETPKAEGTGRVGKKKNSAAGRVGRRRQPHLRRGALALSRPALELTLRALPGTTDSSPKRITKRFAHALSLSRRSTLFASFCFIILRRHHNQKNRRSLQQQIFCRFSAPAPVPAAGLSAALPCGSYQGFGWLPPACYLLLPPRLHTRLSFWQNARLLTTDGKISAHPPGRGGPTDPRNAEGRGPLITSDHR